MNTSYQKNAGLTVWFTGLSSAGKTTLGSAVERRLAAAGFHVELLDGDEMRRHLCRELGFNKADRNENVSRIAYVAELLTRHGVVVLVSAIAPYRDGREAARSRIGRFVEVYVNAPLETCEHRDVKGLYRRARAGEIPNLTGVNDPYEAPLRPDVECHTERESLEESVAKVMIELQAWLPELAASEAATPQTKA